ncbi:MAG: outer membrane beta-barrel protein, partial [Chitinophagaceae bacterium]|nr:outer membrane beta-barrel protein [Chitinophagaceae bacterium]
KRKSFGTLNFGLQKKLKSDKGSFRFNVTDIFNTDKFRGAVNIPEHNLIMNRTMQFMPRTFRLTYSTNFGRSQVKSRRNRVTGSEEERKRVD